MRPLTVGRLCGTLAPFVLLVLAVAVLCPFCGYEGRAPLGLFESWWADPHGRHSTDAFVVTELRIPRVLLGLLAGGALALSGAAFQGLLRNPLAEPFTLGVASGSALGASAAIYLEPRLRLVSALTLGPLSGVQVASLVGAGLAVALVYALAQRRRTFSMMALILAGVTFSLMASALILFVRYLADPHQAVLMDRWLMGSLDVVGFGDVGSLMPLLLPGLLLLVAQAGALNQLGLGEELAAGRGVSVVRLERLVFFAGSLVTAAVVAVTGPIGFVGLLVPHVVRRLIGADHRLLLPASFLAGGAFLALCDLGTLTLFGASQLPVGILTALLGGPLFLLLLQRAR